MKTTHTTNQDLDLVRRDPSTKKHIWDWKMMGQSMASQGLHLVVLVNNQLDNEFSHAAGKVLWKQVINHYLKIQNIFPRVKYLSEL